MSSIIRRTLATAAAASSSLAAPPITSLATTLPQAVRRRRDIDASHNRSLSPKTLPPTLEAEFQHLRAQGQYKGDEASGRKSFWDKQVAWRSRIRGVSLSKGPNGESRARARRQEVDVHDNGDAGAEAEADAEAAAGEGAVGTSANPIGQRIYLPSAQIRLMRNHTPPGEAYDPHVATFRIPHSATKTDLRSYLAAVYSLSVSFIRTDNYFAPVKRQQGGQVRPISGSTKSYKRAVVGLHEPFHYPDDVDEMHALGRETGVGTALADKRKAWLEGNFRIEGTAEVKKRALMKFHKGYRWRGKTHDNEGNVMREIMRRRAAKETRLAEEVGKMHAEVSGSSGALAAA